MKTLIATLLFLVPLISQAQKVEKKFSNKMCECTDKIDANTPAKDLGELIQNCLDIAVAVNRQELKAVFQDQREFPSMKDYILDLQLKTIKNCESYRTLSLKAGREAENTEDRTGMKHNVPAECLTIHDGTFYYLVDDAQVETYLTRKGTVQYEGKNGTDIYLRSEIKWLDECTYVATFIETNDPQAKAFFKKGQEIIVTITHVEGNKFSFFTLISGAKVNGDMIKVSEEFLEPKKD